MAIFERFSKAWRAFTNKDPTPYELKVEGPSYSMKPDRPKFSRGVDRTIVTSFYNKVAVDCASVRLQHVKVDEEDRFLEEIDSPLNYCLNQQANVDQTGRDLLRDIVISLLDEGCVAIVPITTDKNIRYNNTFDIYELRVGKVEQWYPKDVRVRLYNQESGTYESIILPKASVALPENPFYTIMNEPNSILKRLVHKLSLIDTIDDQNASGKLDVIIQLPYVIKTEARMKQAEERRAQIEAQLTGSKYGIAYTDGTEKITQLNRPVENNLLNQVELYTKMFYNQMGITEEIMNNSASEEAKNEYFSHIIEPILTAISEAMSIKFLSLTARTQGQSIRFYKQPLKFITMSSMADLADKLLRNEVLSPNEMRQLIGLKPSDQPGSDDLRNRNNEATPAGMEGEMLPEGEYDPGEEAPQDVEDFKSKLQELATMESDIDELEKLAQDALSEGKVLIHAATYKSQYYDPQKAHEYYEQHKTLKGYANRYGGHRDISTAGLNEKGREIAKDVKRQIDEKKKSDAERIREATKSSKDAAKNERKQVLEKMNTQLKSNIAALKSQLASMNPAQKKHAKIKIRSEIEKLRGDMSDFREYLSEYYTKINEDLSTKSKQSLDANSSKYLDEYASEIKKMLQDPNLVKTSSKKRSNKDEKSWKLAVSRNAKGLK